MSNTLFGFQSNVFCGLGSWTHTVVTAGIWNASATINEVPPSGITLTIAQSGSQSVSVSLSSPAAAQQVMNLQQLFNCAANDVITITLSSSNANDNQLNTVKTIAVVTRVH